MKADLEKAYDVRVRRGCLPDFAELQISEKKDGAP